MWRSLPRISIYSTRIYCVRSKTIEFGSFTWNTPIERRIISSAKSFSFQLRRHFFLRETKRHDVGTDIWMQTVFVVLQNFKPATDIDRNIAFNLASVAWMRQFFSNVWNTTSCACAHTATIFVLLFCSIYWKLNGIECVHEKLMCQEPISSAAAFVTDTHTHTRGSQLVVENSNLSTWGEHLTAKSQTASLNYTSTSIGSAGYI